MLNRDNKISPVTPDTALHPIEEPKTIERSSTAGMTTKVVKGSMWTLGGSVLPLAVSFISTPFIIRFLGAESYGVLLLVGLIPTYFTFADFGMGIASTKFASEAFVERNGVKESEVVWTATAVAAVSSLVIAIPIVVLSEQIVTALNVPEHLLHQASVALRVSSIAFVLGVLASVLNSPMLARLRMDLNTVTQAAPKILLALVTPLILYLGGGIVEAVYWAFIVAVATFFVVVGFSMRLLPELLRPRVSLTLLPPLLRFGAGILFGSIAAILLVNFEKLALSRMISVTSLAYYSVAYTLANIAMLFSTAMTQSLVPAFSQLLSPDKRPDLDSLFGSTLRITLVWLLPLTTVLFVIARPFFQLWAGEDFGRESTLPFYLLLIGVAFNMLAFIQHSLIVSMGRTGLLAVLYWIEFVLYAALSVILIYYLGIVGAALAWSIRVVGDAIVFIFLGQRLMGMSFRFRDQIRGLILPFLVLVPSVVLAAYYRDALLLPAILTPICIGVYSVLIWNTYLHGTEKQWIKDRLPTALRAKIN
jgi:O-antigen/teichoic acid export membrane protein